MYSLMTYEEKISSVAAVALMAFLAYSTNSAIDRGSAKKNEIDHSNDISYVVEENVGNEMLPNLRRRPVLDYSSPVCNDSYVLSSYDSIRELPSYFNDESLY